MSLSLRSNSNLSVLALPSVRLLFRSHRHYTVRPQQVKSHSLPERAATSQLRGTSPLLLAATMRRPPSWKFMRSPRESGTSFFTKGTSRGHEPPSASGVAPRGGTSTPSGEFEPGRTEQRVQDPPPPQPLELVTQGR